MIRRVLATAVLVLSVSVMSSSTVLAAKPVSGGGGGTSATPLGNDISWPQCGTKPPSGQAFGVVGVNDGLANTTNPCLSQQLSWANTSTGKTSQAKVQLYVNTANPGGLNTASWPSNNTDPAGNVAPNPYGTCNHGDTTACAWQYGWNRAVEDAGQRLPAAASAAGLSTTAASYRWWLDIETGNTWKTAGTAADYASNVADIEGMTAYFKSAGAAVGLYSTAPQWQSIVGQAVSTTSNVNGLANWRPSGSSLKNAQANCSVAPLTSNGWIELTQYISKNLDYDYACV